MPRGISCYVKLLRSLSQPAFSGGRSPSSDASVGSRRRSSSSYFRLPSDGILGLSVLKLDGSSFDVRVARTASVRDLKDAVEDLFSSELRDSEDGKGSFSWSHVWGHFCLCYQEHKLTDNKACLKTFGINDGDQLHFMRHLSLNQESNKRKSSNARAQLDQQRMSPTGSEVQGEVCKGVGSSPLVDKSNRSFGRLGSVELKLRRLCLLGGRSRYSRLRTTQVTEI